MRRLLVLSCLTAIVALALAAPAMAQAAPKGDIAVSYSVLYDKEMSSDLPGTNGWLPTGWLVAGSARVTGPLSIVGEVGANYKGLTVEGVDVDVNVYSFLGGVKYSPRVTGNAKPFLQMLVGLARANAAAMGQSGSDNAFAMQIGGGVDIAATRKVAVRIQGDYRGLRANGGTGNEFRFATGVVYNF
jgi:opacity protein-like surface antigen